TALRSSSPLPDALPLSSTSWRRAPLVFVPPLRAVCACALTGRLLALRVAVLRAQVREEGLLVGEHARQERTGRGHELGDLGRARSEGDTAELQSRENPV